MKLRCNSCGFKFESNAKGRPAVRCATCRKDTANKWRALKAKETDKPKKEVKIDAI